MKEFLTSKSLEEIIAWMILIILAIVLLVIIYLLTDRELRFHKLNYQLENCQNLISKYEEDIFRLQQKLHEGNIKYLESKKEWLETIYQILLTHQASVFQIKQDIEKVEKQILKLKSK